MLRKLAKIFLRMGTGILLLGGMLWIGAGRLGRLPGDIWLARRRFTLYLPITTSLLLSLSLSALLGQAQRA